MTHQIAKPNQGRGRAAAPFAPDGFPFIIGSAVAGIGAYGLARTTAVIILTRKKVA